MSKFNGQAPSRPPRSQEEYKYLGETSSLSRRSFTFSRGICISCKGLKPGALYVLKLEKLLKSQTWTQKYVLQTSDKDQRPHAAPGPCDIWSALACPYVSAHQRLTSSGYTHPPTPAPRDKWFLTINTRMRFGEVGGITGKGGTGGVINTVC